MVTRPGEVETAVVEPYFVDGLDEAREALASELRQTGDRLSLNEVIVNLAVEWSEDASPPEQNPVIQVELEGYIHQAIQMEPGDENV